MKYVIVAGGEKPQGKLPLLSLAQGDYLICADSGANHIYELGYVPDLIVGDFDSVEPEILQAYRDRGCPTKTYPVEKDYTDTELAIQLALRASPSQIDLLGLIGSRLDHSLANVFLLTAYYRENCKIRLLGPDYMAWVTKDQTVVTGEPGDYVSILPVSETASGITMEGFKYPLTNATILRGSTHGISNELLTNEGFIGLQNGVLFVIHTKNSE